MNKPNMMFYHDGRHPLIYMYEPPMQKEEYEQGVDELIGTPIDCINFCLGDGRTVLHDTKVGELWGHANEKWAHTTFRRAHQNAVGLIEGGNDPLRVIIERAHEKGFLLYPTLLVQQRSGDLTTDTRGSQFRFNHKHLDIGAAGGVEADWPGYHFADFKHQVVRDERFALVEETLSRYDVDGFELQLNYGFYYFHPEEVEDGRHILTEWIKKVHDAVKASGPDRELVVRIPSTPEACLSVGMDPGEWVRQGLVDVIVAEEFDGPSLVNSTADYRPMVELAECTKTRVLAATYSNVDSDRMGQGSIEMIRAAASNYWAQGVDGLYLAQWFSNWPYGPTFYEKLRELPDPEVMAPRDKFYFIPTTTARFNEPAPRISMQLPKDMEEGKTNSFIFRISDDLPRWDKVGRIHEVLLRIRAAGVSEIDTFSFTLNGTELPDRLRRTINRMYPPRAPRFRRGGYWYIFKLDRDHWPLQGENTLKITLDNEDEVIADVPTVLDIELEIKYLMGKSYHRGFVDPDLGPYESTVE